MKVFKAIAATAAVITCSIGNPHPAEAGIFYDLKNQKMVLLNDGETTLVWTDGRTVSFKTDMGPKTG